MNITLLRCCLIQSKKIWCHCCVLSMVLWHHLCADRTDYNRMGNQRTKCEMADFVSICNDSLTNWQAVWLSDVLAPSWHNGCWWMNEFGLDWSANSIPGALHPAAEFESSFCWSLWLLLERRYWRLCFLSLLAPLLLNSARHLTCTCLSFQLLQKL